MERITKGILTVLLFGFAITTMAEHPLKLWYKSPASVWVEALPIGNGHLGAMVFGDPKAERVQLNEETLWAGGPNSNANPDALAALPVIRQLIFDKKYKEAQDLVGKSVISNTNHGMAYQTAGDLWLTFPEHNNYTSYYRELDIRNAVATTRYVANGVEYTREYLASLPDSVIAVRVKSSERGMVNFSARLSSPLQTACFADGNDLVLQGKGGSMEGQEGKIRFTTRIRIAAKNGDVAVVGDSMLTVNNADEATIYVSIGTNFVDYHTLTADADGKAKRLIDTAKMSFDDLKNRHAAAYRHYFDRVSLDLGETEAAKLPTNERILHYSEGNDPQLAELYFQFGRYLLISCSQPGGQPANLQGIWNDQLTPPWDSKYTTNINVEMNYWPAEVTNLTEMHQPMLQMVKELAQTGTKTAHDMYGARGWVLHHNTDIWRTTGAVDYSGPGAWVTANAWLCRHLWEHFLHTGDRAFLHNAYTVMKGASEFFLDFLTEEPDHKWLVVAPSNSPENHFMTDEYPITVCAGTTMDNQLVYELLTNTMQAAQLLGIDKAFADSLEHTRSRLAPMQIGQYGQLQEWLFDWDNPDDHHRHQSHLYGLFPGNLISPYRTPELFEAARTSLNQRGDIATGWSMGWKVCLWARLLDRNRAYKLITDQLQLTGSSQTDYKKSGGTYPNLFDAHPPFQIDGNFGCAAGIAEMMLQSHDGYLFVLPALPDQWAEGSVRGLVARGGFVIDMDWSNGRITYLKVHSRLGGQLRIRTATPLAMKDGSVLRPAEGENSNPYYQVPYIPRPIVSPKAHVEQRPMAETFIYDIQTSAGHTYELMPNRNAIDAKRGDYVINFVEQSY